METATTYQKHNSFHDLHVAEGKTNPAEQSARGQKILANYTSKTEQEGYVLDQVLGDLQGTSRNKIRFSITPFVADEMRLIEDKDIPRYLFHRYRYEIYPQLHKLDDYPPYLQIEPSSICNYRCVFCYQTDEGFSEKKSDHMGTMSLEMYKQIVDHQSIDKFYQFLRQPPLFSLDTRPSVCPAQVLCSYQGNLDFHCDQLAML